MEPQDAMEKHNVFGGKQNLIATDFWTLTIQGSKPSTIQPGASSFTLII
jgi:hypothetical protein